MKKRLTLSLNQELSTNLLKTKIDVLVIGVSEGRILNSIAEKIDKATQGSIKKLIKRGEFESKVGQTAYIATNDGTSAERIFLIGCGKPTKDLSSEDLDKIAMSVTTCLTSKKSSTGIVSLPSMKHDSKENTDETLLQKIGTAVESKAYTYDAKLNKKNKKSNDHKQDTIVIESKEREAK